MSKRPDECAVLVVEDDPAISRLINSVLGRAGYNVQLAADGVEAVLKLGLTDFDVVVLDLMMPNLDGFTLIQTLARHDPARLHQIIVTSAASPAVIKARLEGEPFAVIPKPFNISELVAKVRECVLAGDSSDAASR